jgi:hypothetical protein
MRAFDGVHRARLSNGFKTGFPKPRHCLFNDPRRIDLQIMDSSPRLGIRRAASAALRA